MREKEVCAVCGMVSDPRKGGTGLQYQNLKTGARYCCEEHMKQDPDWNDDLVWIG
jgi:hypothetical protein